LSLPASNGSLAVLKRFAKLLILLHMVPTKGMKAVLAASGKAHPQPLQRHTESAVAPPSQRDGISLQVWKPSQISSLCIDFFILIAQKLRNIHHF
jgi:hypothetical protein